MSDTYRMMSMNYDHEKDEYTILVRSLDENNEPCEYNSATITLALNPSTHAICYEQDITDAQPLYEIDVLRACIAKLYELYDALCAESNRRDNSYFDFEYVPSDVFELCSPEQLTFEVEVV